MGNDDSEQSGYSCEKRKIRGPRFGKRHIEIVNGIVRIFDGSTDVLVYEQPIDYAEFLAWTILETIAEAKGQPIVMP